MDLNKVSKIFIYLLVFFLPIFFLPFTQNVLDFQKQILLLVLVSASLFCFIIKILLDGKIILNFHPFNFFLFALVLILGLSTLFSTAKSESLFGLTLPSSQSFLTLFLLVITFLIFTNLFNKKEIFYILFLLSISIFLAEIFATLQIFQKFIFPLDVTRVNSFNTFGSLNSLAIFLACFLPLILVLFSISKRFFKVFFFLQILLTLLLLILINSKISWVLSIFGSILILVFWVIQKETFGKSLLIFPLFVLAISTIFLFFNFPSFLPLPAEVSLGQKISFDIAFKSLKESPIFGTGPGTFVFNFSKYRGTSLNNTIFWNTRFFASASKFLDILATVGIFGTISFLALIFFPIFIGFSQFFKPTLEKLDLVLLFAIFFSLFSISLSFFLYSSNLTLEFVYFLLLASLFTILPAKKIEFSFEKKILSFTFAIFSLLILVLDFGILLLTSQRYAAEIFYWKGIKQWQRGDIEGTISNLEKAIRIYPKVDLYFRDLSQAYLIKAQDKVQKGDFNIQNEIARAIDLANQASNLSPKNVANFAVRAFNYQSLAGIVGGAEDWAIKMWDEAMKLEPANPYYLTQKGIMLIRKGILSQDENEKNNFFTQAEDLFRKAIDLKSDYAPAHFQLAILWQAQGKIKEAISKLEETKNLAPFDIGLAFQLGVAYYQDKNYQKAREELERATTLDPNYANALYFLGLTLDQLGEKKLALEKFKRVSELNPDVEEVKKIISNLEAEKSALEGILPTVPPQTPIQERPPEIKK